LSARRIVVVKEAPMTKIPPLLCGLTLTISGLSASRRHPIVPKHFDISEQ
jgi:hypothetical protein